MGKGNPKGYTKRKPIELLELSGKSHLTKEYIEARKKEEIQAPVGIGNPPDYLLAAQKKKFREYAEALIDLGIYSDLDADCLATYVISSMEYQRLTREIRKIKLRYDDEDSCRQYKAIAIERDRAFTQAKACATDLGLNISSRCRLVIPKVEEPPKNKFDQFVV